MHAVIGDPAKVAVPMAGVTSTAYAATRAGLVEAPAQPRLPAGNPWPFEQVPTGDCAALASACSERWKPKTAYRT